jgi:hypothetical protein
VVGLCPGTDSPTWDQTHKGVPRGRERGARPGACKRLGNPIPKFKTSRSSTSTDEGTGDGTGRFRQLGTQVSLPSESRKMKRGESMTTEEGQVGRERCNGEMRGKVSDAEASRGRTGLCVRWRCVWTCDVVWWRTRTACWMRRVRRASSNQLDRRTPR